MTDPEMKALTPVWAEATVEVDYGEIGSSKFAERVSGAPDTVAATLRAIADRLDPPKPKQVTRGLMAGRLIEVNQPTRPGLWDGRPETR